MLTTKEEVINWLEKHFVNDYIIHNDLTVDVNQNVYLRNLNEDQLPLQFGIIKGNFSCNVNNLVSLKGCPLEVHGSFNCSNNELTSLQYCPTIVTENFNCDINYLTSLEHLPQNIKQNFTCSHNKLKSLKGCPQVINGVFDCSANLLTSLKFAPKIINKDFFCYQNKITKFDYEQFNIYGDFCCSHTKKQTILFLKDYYQKETFHIKFSLLMNYLLSIKLQNEILINKVKNNKIKL